MSKTIEIERDAAVSEGSLLKKQIAQIHKDTESMKRKFNSLQKDSE